MKPRNISLLPCLERDSNVSICCFLSVLLENMRSPQKSLNLASVTPGLFVIALLEKSKPSQKETKLAAGFGLVTGFELHPSIKMLMMRNAICFIYVFIFMLLIFYSSHGLSRTFLFSCWCIAYMGWTFCNHLRNRGA